jgi:type IV pilus assembly protein PilY1
MMRKTKRFLLCAAGAGTVWLSSASAAPLNLSETPLFVSGYVEPNIMFVLDSSGSMRHVVPDTPYDESKTDFLCPSSNLIDNDDEISLRVTSSGTPYIYVRSYEHYDWGTGSGTGPTGRDYGCFDPDLIYDARLNAVSGSNGSTKSPSGSSALYTGHYLNWYFGSDPAADCSSYVAKNKSPSWGTDARHHPCAIPRMEVLREAGKDLVNGLNNVRVGLATYDGSDGAWIRQGVDSIDKNRADLISTIDGVQEGGFTPLAETLHQIGRYFVGEGGSNSYDGMLTLHPDDPDNPKAPGEFAEEDKDDDTVFDTSPRYSAGVSQQSPITSFCQQSFSVFLTDGLSTQDYNIGSDTGLTDYDGDCTDTHPNYNGFACDSGDRKDEANTDYRYESGLSGTDYMDDVAMALGEMNLRPDLDDFLGNEAVNSLKTYMIGFADPVLENDPLIRDTAEQGGGEFFLARDSAGLVEAFTKATSDIFSRIGSAAAVGATSGSIRAGSRIYQGRFNSGTWVGQLLSYRINSDGSLASDYEWDAAEELTNTYASTSRTIMTYDPDANPDPEGIPFRWPSLNTDQKTALNMTPAGTPDTEGEARLGYIRGLRDNEAPDGNRYRERQSLLGDIVNSEPLYVGSAPFDYEDEFEAGNSGETYAEFKESVDDRKAVVYVGANDGMLHGFDASVDADGDATASGGQEVLAYIPNKLIPKLTELTDRQYTHHAYVDGSPIAGDIYTSDDNWMTVLAGALGRGAQGLYALDVTDPSSFSEANAENLVLWEYTDADDADLGFVYGKPNIVRMAPANNGPWAVLAGNGYNNTVADGNASTTGNAALFVINAETGALIAKVDTGVGAAQDPLGNDRPNGLAQPTAVDMDGDHVVDRVYAGDLFGNVWRFNVGTNNAGNWDADKLFDAESGSGEFQPITSKVAVSRHLTEDGLMIYFGTGKYLEPGDINEANPTTQTFYGIWDDPTKSDTVDRGELYEQSIEDEITNPDDSNAELRLVSNNTGIDWSTDRGWMLDLINTSGGNADNNGERVITDPVYLRPTKRFPNGRILFTTLIPDSRECGYGGTGWLMELDPNDGSRLEHPPFDITKDGNIDANDKVDSGGSEQAPGGKRIVSGPGSGALTTPKVLEGNEAGEIKVTSDTTGAVTVTKEPGRFVGRASWRELFPE